jgi:hypothetical protein
MTYSARIQFWIISGGMMATVANNAGSTAPPSGAYPSDETILGIFDESGAGGNDRADDFDALLAGADGADDLSGEHAASVPHRAGAAKSQSVKSRSRTFGTGATNSGSSRDDAANNNSAQSAQQGGEAPMPEWLTRVSAADPASAPELSALWQRSAALEVFDHAFYSGDVSAQQQLVTQLYSDDPGALRAMVAAATQLLESSENNSVARVPRARGISDTNSDRHSIGNDSTNAAKIPAFGERGLHNQSVESQNENSRQDAGATNSARENTSGSFNPAAYAQFEQSTNDAVVSDVTRAIERALDRTLPNGIADGARKRISADTLSEVHTALRGDRQLASQVAGALRNSQFDSAARDAITRLIVSRARGVVPEAARRVIGEWTGSVLASHRERTSKQQASSSRVDLIGGALPQAVPQRAVKSTDINYRATSDEDILGW